MSAQDPVVMVSVPTAVQQRLRWKPAKDAAFRHLQQFSRLLEVYCFATGKRYERKPVDHPKKEALFVCKQCRKGRVRLRIHRKNATHYWWVVRTAATCECGSPPNRLENLRLHGLTALVGYTMEPKSDWTLLANTCFPCGYKRKKGSPERKWSISCRRKDCPGQLQIELEYINYARRYDKFRIQSAVDCCEECKQVGKQNKDGPVPVRAPHIDDRSCPLCYQEETNDWIEFPCGKPPTSPHMTCTCCLQKLVRACPSVVATNPTLMVFKPDDDPTHCYSCPFCKVAYTPRTKVIQHRVREGGVVITREVEVGSLVVIPFGYQSFDDTLPAYIETAARYDALFAQYREYEDNAGQVSVPFSVELLAELHDMAQEIVPRLRSLQQSGRFRRHEHTVLNFMDAVEHLHVNGLDVGFLFRVATEVDENQRRILMQTAYRYGWDGTENIGAHLLFRLLERNGLVEVIDLVSNDSDSDYSDAS